MHRAGRVGSALALFGVAMALAFVPVTATSGSSQEGSAPQAEADNSIPAYHAQAPKGALPETLKPETFPDPLVKNAYAVAARIKKTLYQQPCYCHCDRSQGHGSLLDCFAGKHAAECQVCIREGFYAYEQSRKNKTAAQIREGIEHGEWQQVDTSKYMTPLPAK